MSYFQQFDEDDYDVSELSRAELINECITLKGYGKSKLTKRIVSHLTKGYISIQHDLVTLM